VFPDKAQGNEVSSVFTIATDIHEDIVARDALIAARRRLDRFTDNIPMPLVYLDIDCKLRFVNKAWCRMDGIASEDALGRHVREVRGETIWLEQKPHYEKAQGGQQSDFSRLVRGIVGGPRWMRTSYFPDFDDEGHIIGIYTITTDVHELTSTQEKLRRSVERDALTDALGLAQRLEQTLASRRAGEQLLAVCFLDLDGFKAVNDRYGHDVGDLLLAEVARRLSASVRQTDTVARLAGDEFVLLLEGESRPGEVMAIVEGIIARVSQRVPAAGEPLRVGVSIGVALRHSHHDTAEVLLKQADEAMYEAKRAGRNRVIAFYQSPEQPECLPEP